MSTRIYEQLQAAFVCTKCGHCCSIGGDVALTADEVELIKTHCGISISGLCVPHFREDADKPGVYYINQTAPCLFYDQVDRGCSIHGIRPFQCYMYPFLLYAIGGCTLDAVLECPSARKQLEELLK